MNIVVADIGGTHARFALAELAPGRRPEIGPMRRYRTREHDGLASAWGAFRADNGGRLPVGAAVAVAAPIEGEVLTFMNNDWRLKRANLKEELGLDQIVLLNDFGAVAHAVAVVTVDELEPICGPGELPADGLTTVLGAGTGLGCAILDRRGGGLNVIETEASHIGFSPLDAEEEIVARALTSVYGRASVERIVSGPGLIDVFVALGGAGDWDATNAGELWDRAIAGTDVVAARALALWARCFGGAMGDISLAHGAMGIAVTGSLANRIKDLLRGPAFVERLRAKGRYRPRMERVPVRLVTLDEPGLLGAAVAFDRAFPA